MLLKRAVWMTLVTYSLVLAAVCLSPMGGDSTLAMTKTRRIINNMLHIPAFAAHAWLCILAVRPALARGFSLRYLLIGGTTALLYSFALEIGQGFVPGRYTSIGDMGLNTAGVITVALVLSLMPRGKAMTRRERLEHVPD